MQNAAELIIEIDGAATERRFPDLVDVRRWHTALYRGCSVPNSGYIGHFRGESDVPALADYEVGVGPVQPDGLPEKVGVPAACIAGEMDLLIAGIHGALVELDRLVAIGMRPQTVDELQAIVRLTAVVHGEWVRLHPFANGNGRIARVWVAVIARRYSLPVFLDLKPRPTDVAYRRAGRDSMGRPPDFEGKHSTAVAVFGHLLSISLMQ